MINKKESVRLSRSIRNDTVHKASETLVKYMKDLQYSSEHENINVLRIMERTFFAKSKGLKLLKKDVKSWSKLFNKCEKIFDISFNNISEYSQVVLMETISHRYADYYRLNRKNEFHLNNGYAFARDISNKNNFYNHKDASSFWNGYA